MNDWTDIWFPRIFWGFLAFVCVLAFSAAMGILVGMFLGRNDDGLHPDDECEDENDLLNQFERWDDPNAENTIGQRTAITRQAERSS